ncbi:MULTISPECIES: hypothetical protein [Methanobacterium]|uniref:Uncharacterized protein n=1 Tax=Methanobacterium veterum TaxID=408577 RepID=A0A9E5A764_9EURY|nr:MULTISPECIES: hypothetical protein [Methanobacterium]MCZ3367072.1 hypothetical protein [Methanobacterium veterum]MCZ3373781.1 hypothetical protein [Methanobacterium veterum]
MLNQPYVNYLYYDPNNKLQNLVFSGYINQNLWGYLVQPAPNLRQFNFEHHLNLDDPTYYTVDTRTNNIISTINSLPLEELVNGGISVASRHVSKQITKKMYTEETLEKELFQLTTQKIIAELAKMLLR